MISAFGVDHGNVSKGLVQNAKAISFRHGLKPSKSKGVRRHAELLSALTPGGGKAMRKGQAEAFQRSLRAEGPQPPKRKW